MNKEWKCVYVVGADDGTTKIGVSKNPKQRIATIRTASGKNLIQEYITEPCSNSFLIEAASLKKFESDSLFGEWVKTDFEIVKNFVKEFYENFHEEELQSQCNEDVLIDFVKKLWRVSITDEDDITEKNREFYEKFAKEHTEQCFETIANIAIEIMNINEVEFDCRVFGSLIHMYKIGVELGASSMGNTLRHGPS